MNWQWIALISLLALSYGAPLVTGVEFDQWPIAVRWATAIGFLVCLVAIGWDQRRQEKAADTWRDDPRKSALENWMAKRRQRFNVARGFSYFIMGLVVFTLMVGISAALGEGTSIGRALAFVILMSVVAGLIGMFTDNVPL